MTDNFAHNAAFLIAYLHVIISNNKPLIAFLLDLLIGDPPWLYRRIMHPVALFGLAISWGEKALNRGSEQQQLMNGALLGFVLITAAGLLGFTLDRLFSWLSFGLVLELITASVLLAFNALKAHIRPIYSALSKNDITQARKAVSMVVGRNTDQLDSAGITRASIETLAENLSDGGVAPLLFYACFGLTGLFAYKMINTLDSMIGHRSARYLYFGRFSARIDDAANYIPARITGLMILATSTKLFSIRQLRLWHKEAKKHASINAGYAEAAMALCLDVSLAGPRDYGSYQSQDDWIGQGRRDLGPQDLKAALKRYDRVLIIISMILFGLSFTFV